MPGTKKTEAGARVSAYLAARPPAARRRLKELRAAIRAAAPDAVDHFSYGVPGYRLAGRPLVWYAAFTRHVSLFPMTAAIRRTHAAALEGYGTSTGTVRFPLADPVPAALVRKLVRSRITEVRGKR